MKTYFSTVNNSLYSTFFTLLFGCFSTFIFAQNPPNAYLIDHRGVPQFDESDVMQSASYSDLQTAGLSSDHLQTPPEGEEFYWEFPNEDIPAEDFSSSGVPDAFGFVRFAGDVYAFENQYYFVPKDHPGTFPADVYNADIADFHFLPSAQAMYLMKVETETNQITVKLVKL